MKEGERAWPTPRPGLDGRELLKAHVRAADISDRIVSLKKKSWCT